MVLFLIVVVMPHGIFRVITAENCIKFFKTIYQHELKKYTSKNLPHLKLDGLKDLFIYHGHLSLTHLRLK